MKRFLIGQLGAYGDCLFATTIARQIKHDHPDCHLTWAVGSNYKNILDNNPYIDAIWGYPVASRWESVDKWYEFKSEAIVRKERGEFDEIYFTQAYPGNPQAFYDTLRASMFRIYPNPITVPLDPVLVLSAEEVLYVAQFADRHDLKSKKNVILVECSPQSNQSFVTYQMLWEIATKITDKFENTCVIMSGHKAICCNTNRNIIDGSVLTFRENAEITKYCTLLVGTGSGITQVCQSDWAKTLPTIQLLQKHTVASIIVDHNFFGLSTESIIEMTSCNEAQIIGCIGHVIEKGVISARLKYCERIVPDFTIIRFHMRFATAVLYHKYFDIIPAFIIACRDYGFSIRLFGFLSTFPSSVLTLISRRIHGVK